MNLLEFLKLHWLGGCNIPSTIMNVKMIHGRRLDAEMVHKYFRHFDAEYARHAAGSKNGA